MAEKRSKQNQSISMALLESYREALYEIEKYFKSLKFDNIEDVEVKIKIAKSIMDIGEKIGKNIESLDRLEEKVKKEEKETVSRRGNAENSLFEIP